MEDRVMLRGPLPPSIYDMYPFSVPQLSLANQETHRMDTSERMAVLRSRSEKINVGHSLTTPGLSSNEHVFVHLSTPNHVCTHITSAFTPRFFKIDKMSLLFPPM
jgi:hypothetical protein